MTVIPQHAMFCPLNQILHLKIIAITVVVVVITAAIVVITAVIVIIPFVALTFTLLINN